MRNFFDSEIRYQIYGNCLSPMHVGDSSGNSDAVLRDMDGKPFIQATSITGALRNHVHRTWPDVETALFETVDDNSCLIVTDGRFAEESPEAPAACQVSYRPRVRINPETGTSDDTGYFATGCVETGARLHFTLILRQEKQRVAGEPPLERALEDALAALSHGNLTLGGQKSNGFGQVSLDLVRSRKWMYDLTDPQDRQCWLEEEPPPRTEHLSLNGTASNQVEFVVKGITENLLINAGISQLGDGPDQIQMTNGRDYIIPGTSLKGLIRGQMQAIAHMWELDPSLLEHAYGRAAVVEGENGVAGKLIFHETTLVNPMKRITHRIRLDRFTGGVMNRNLVAQESVAGSVTMKITVPADNEIVCALLLYALRDLALGCLTVGSGYATGRGRIQVKTIEIQAGEQSAVLHCRENEIRSLDDPDALIKGWMDAVSLRKGVHR